MTRSALKALEKLMEKAKAVEGMPLRCWVVVAVGLLLDWVGGGKVWIGVNIY